MDNLIEKFYRHVLPPTGEYYLAVSKPGSKLTQRKLPDLDALIAAMAMLRGADANVYYATGTFKGNRTITDVQQKQAYYLDIDYGSDNKIYRDANEVIEAIREHVRSDDLPSPSYCVRTGHGFHFYWCLEKPISRDQWLIGAKNLKEFCKTAGIHADHGITGDVARILRAPGTKNVKDPAHPLHVGLTPQLPSTEITIYPTDLFAKGAGMFPELSRFIDPNDLSAMPVPEVEYAAADILRQCGIMRRSAMENGANDTGEVWGNNLLILGFTTDGHKIKHHISSGHPEYSEASTEAKWETKKNCGAAPTTCDFYSGLPNCGQICAACPVKGTVTSPLHLGRVETAVEVLPAPTAAPSATGQLELPDGYVQNKDGLWKRTGEDDEGRPTFEPVTPPNFNKQIVDLVVSKDAGYRHNYRLIFQASTEFEVAFSAKELSEPQSWDRLLAEKRMPLNEPFRKRFRSFIVSWIGQLQDKSVKYGQTHFGWAEDFSAFGVGSEVYKDGKELRNDMADKVMQAKYSQTGTLEDWTAKANSVIHDREASAAVIAASLAAPLIGFSRDPGCVLSVHGDSGTGKTTVMKIGQTLWGHPIKSMMSLDDTALSMLNALGIMKNLPAFWDEVRGSASDERLMQTVFRLTAGRERTRLTQTVEQREVHEWQTILITSSNISAMGTIASQTRDSDAGIMRIFELTMPPITQSVGGLDVTQCYGTAARVYARYLAENVDKMRALVTSTEESLRKALGAHEPERFRVSLLAAMVAGAQVGKEVLGLEFDISSLVNYLRMEFISLRASSKQHRESYSAEALLIQFINEMTPNRLVTDKIAGRGKGSVNTLTFPRNSSPVYVQIAQSGQALLCKPQFDQWVETKVGLKPHKTKEEMLKVAGVKSTQRPLGGGTAFSTPRGYVYAVDMTDQSFGGVFDSLYQPATAPATGKVASISSAS